MFILVWFVALFYFILKYLRFTTIFMFDNQVVSDNECFFALLNEIELMLECDNQVS